MHRTNRDRKAETRAWIRWEGDGKTPRRCCRTSGINDPFSLFSLFSSSSSSLKNNPPARAFITIKDQKFVDENCNDYVVAG
jgi:hypothetical protein